MKLRSRGMLGIALALSGACSSDKANPFHEKTHGDASCSDGTEGCPCYGNDTCDHGLVCASGTCIERRTSFIDASSSVDAFSPPSSGGRSPSSGGSSQSMGGDIVVRDGGPSETDGGGAVGSGGRPAAGGVTGKGGTMTADTGAGGDNTNPNPHPFAIFIMLDRSSSMIMPPPGATTPSWDNAVAALTAFVNDADSKGIDIGLGVFPVGMNNTFDCAAGSDCGMPVVPIAPLPANAMPMLAAMTAQYPTSLAFTPTECALRGMINECLTYKAASPSSEQCVAVLVTDGTPTQCNLDEATLTAIVADGKSRGIATFALGLPGSDLNVLNQYAIAGGTTAAVDVAAGPAAFTAALKQIRAKVMPVNP